MSGTTLEYRDFISRRVLAPIASAAFARLRDHDIVLRDGALNFIRILQHINVSDASGHSVSSLADVNVVFVVKQPISV